MNVKNIASITCVATLTIFWLYQSFVLPLRIDILLGDIAISIFPLYALFLIFIYLDEEKLRKSFTMLNVIVLHITISFGFMVLVMILLPQVSSQVAFFSQEDAKKKIVNDYRYAELLGGDAQEETRSYITYYHNNKKFFGDIDFKLNFIEGIEDIEAKTRLHTDRETKEFYSTLITADKGDDLLKENLIFRIENFLETNNFESASILLTYYTSLYGVDNLVIQTQKKVDAVFSRMDSISYLTNDSEMNNYYEQLKYFYYLIEKKEVDESSLLLGYFILQAFIKNTKLDKQSEIVWMRDRVVERINKTMFFASEARLNLFDFEEPNSTMFIVDRDQDVYIWSALDTKYAFQTDIAYFNKLDIFSFSKIKREIQWHIYAEYAILKKGKLYLFGIETGTMDIVYTPKVIYQADYIDIPPFLDTGILENTGVMASDIDALQLNPNNLNKKNILQLFALLPSWMQYHLPINMILERIYHKMLLVIMFFIYGIFFIGGFAKISFDNQNFKSGTNYIIVLLIGFVPLYGILENIGIWILRNSMDLVQMIFILGGIAVGVIVVVREIIRIRYSIKRKQDEKAYLSQRKKDIPT